MELPDSFFDFVQAHKDDDCIRLRLKAADNAGFDTKFAINQIEARRKTRYKLPQINSYARFVFPSLLAAEQSTSEDAAAFKRSLFAGRYSSVCDLTGGLGIDTAYISDVVGKVVYIERFADYCDAAIHNFSVLGKHNIEVVNADCREFVVENDRHSDAYYIDPARRGVANSRLFSFADCEPNVLTLLPLLLQGGSEVWLKASPMVDISLAISELAHVTDVYAISVKGECKELLFRIKAGTASEAVIHCADIVHGRYEIFDFLLSEEKSIASLHYADTPLSYLYEPGASILKGGAFKSVANRYAVSKLHKNSHLYTSRNAVPDFPGRRFAVMEVIPFKNSALKGLNARYPAANITVRNFPLTADALRKRLKIKDGGDIYMFATKCNDGGNILIVCNRITS